MAYKDKSKALAKRKEYYKNNREVVLHKQRMKKAFKDWRDNFIVRKPRKPVKDFEIYCTNDVWGIDNNIFLNVDYLRYIPIEHLCTDYWINKEKELEEYWTEQFKGYGRAESVCISDKSYVNPDKEYGLQKDGTIIFYPT